MLSTAAVIAHIRIITIIPVLREINDRLPVMSSPPDPFFGVVLRGDSCLHTRNAVQQRAHYIIFRFSCSNLLHGREEETAVFCVF